jgi:ABC-type Fe3+ transport system permease subunit
MGERARRGLASSLWGETTAQVVSRLLFGLPGAVLVLASTFIPAVILATMTFVRTVNPPLEEAARLSARPLRVLCGITVPLMRPGLVLAATLVFLLALGEFGAPQFLRYAVFPVESFTQFSAFYNFGAATAAAMPLALLTFVVLGAEWFVLREKTQALRPAPLGSMNFRMSHAEAHRSISGLGRVAPRFLCGIEGLDDQEIQKRFNAQRNAEYVELLKEASALTPSGRFMHV